jgi:hypothetical protein
MRQFFGHLISGGRLAAPRARGQRIGISAVLALLLVGFGHAAVAQTNLVQNPSFAITGGSDGTSEQIGSGCGTSCNGLGTVAGWSTSGYNFVYLQSTSDSVGATGVDGNVQLWGPNNNGGTPNGLPTSSPTGGNFIAADGAYEVSAITQTISGLVVGQAVAVSFVWSGAQQYTFTGPTTDQWTVDLGSSPSQSTSILSLPNHGSAGWISQTFYFVPTNTSELLSFLATGTPSGQPPFALLASVSVTTVPEPASLVLLLSAIAGLVVFARYRGSRVAAATA